MFRRVLREPPFRLLGKAFCRAFPNSFSTKVYWEALERPHYAAGLLFAAQEAKSLGIPEISALEFGVATGNGLLMMQAHAASVERETGIKISVFGFDLGTGLPNPTDYRDHPERWKGGDYVMDESRLRKQLSPRTSLVLGNVADTVPVFVSQQSCPVGFVAIDLDFYSSTMAAFQVFTLENRRMLPLTPLYFDDILLPENHRFAGELLAIDDFNSHVPDVKIDTWRGLSSQSAFPDSAWITQMYMAHDLTAAATKREEVASM